MVEHWHRSVQSRWIQTRSMYHPARNHTAVEQSADCSTAGLAGKPRTTKEILGGFSHDNTFKRPFHPPGNITTNNDWFPDRLRFNRNSSGRAKSSQVGTLWRIFRS